MRTVPPRRPSAGSETMPRVSLERVAWLSTVAACLLGAVLLLIAGYLGYGALAVAVGLAAAINLL